MDLWSIILLAGVLQGIFLMTVFLKKWRRGSASFLIVLLGLFAITNFDYLIISTRSYEHFSRFFGISNNFIFLFGPIFYFYVKSYLQQSISFKRVLPHILPFLLSKMLELPIYFISAGQKMAFIETLVSGDLKLQALHIVIFTIQLIHFIIYILLSLKCYLKNVRSKQAAVYPEKNWLFGLFSIMSVYAITVMGLLVFCAYRGTYNIVANYTYSSLLSLATYVISYIAILNPKMVFGETTLKYASHGLDFGESLRLAEKAAELYREKKRYLDAEIRLAVLAGSLETSPQKLSQAINQHFGLSFSDWTNEYRITHAKVLLSNPDIIKSRTILSIAMESGFNSKSAFNDAFKRLTGITPTAFIKQQNVVRNDHNGRRVSE